MKENKLRTPTFFESIFPILFLIIFLSINVFIFKDSSLDGSNQIVLIVSASVASAIALNIGFKWSELQKGIVNSISSAIPSILILFLVGSLAGSWMLSGIVPAMIYYGIQLLNPKIFLIASCLICIIVSVATGSSWTTSATIGIALIGIGKALGISEGLIAGSILSGAYFGDKMSPLSDTTNLSPAVAGSDLFSHIRYLSYTAFPSILICLVLFLFLGLSNYSNISQTNSTLISNAISEKFYLSPILFFVPLFVIFLIYKKTKALPSLFCGTLLGVIFALIFQPDLVKEVSGINDSNFKSLFVGIMKSLYGTISISTSNEIVNELLTSGGMFGMLSTIWLIFSAMIFGGVMEVSGFLKKIVNTILTSV